MGKTLYIKTFGCQMNERDSEIITQLLAPQGYTPTQTPEHADLILINTCSIREKAEQKVFSLLGQFRELKAARPSLLLGLTGCVAQQEGKRIRERMPHVDLIVGTQQIYQLPQLLTQVQERSGQQGVATELHNDFVIPPYQMLFRHASAPTPLPFKRFVTIMQGCNNFCSYCVVPFTRGREISRPFADIIEEVELLVDQGVKEITLLGQNVNSYGLTNQVARERVSFPQLLRHVARIPGVQRLRFTTSHPKDLSPALVRCFAELENLCPHVHLPVQSGSNAVLQRMNRKYTVEEYLTKAETLLFVRPDLCLSTDIIVGFPGETEEDFQATMDLLARVRFHASFSFKYSDRPKVHSATFPDKVAEEVKSRRLAAFQHLQNDISFCRNNEYIDKNIDVMLESCTEEDYRGRSGGNHVVHLQGQAAPHLRPGNIVRVHIEQAGQHSLKGSICENGA